MAIDISSELDTAQQAYVDNSDYDQQSDATKANAFVTACRKLLMLVPSLSESDGKKSEFDLVRIENMMIDAQSFAASVGSTGGGVRHFDMRNFRD